MSERRWSSEAYRQAKSEGAEIETLMRSILKLFADGCLVYRERQQRTGSVQTKSDRLRRLRRGVVANPLRPDLQGPAAVA